MPVAYGGVPSTRAYCFLQQLHIFVVKQKAPAINSQKRQFGVEAQIIVWLPPVLSTDCDWLLYGT